GENHPNPHLVSPPEVDLDPLPFLHARHEAGVEVGIVVVEEDPVGRRVGVALPAEREGRARNHEREGYEQALPHCAQYCPGRRIVNIAPSANHTQKTSAQTRVATAERVRGGSPSPPADTRESGEA